MRLASGPLMAPSWRSISVVPVSSSSRSVGSNRGCLRACAGRDAAAHMATPAIHVRNFRHTGTQALYDEGMAKWITVALACATIGCGTDEPNHGPPLQSTSPIVG